LRDDDGSNHLNATVRWTVAGEGLTEPNNNFFSKEKCKRASSPAPNKKTDAFWRLFFCLAIPAARGNANEPCDLSIKSDVSLCYFDA